MTAGWNTVVCIIALLLTFPCVVWAGGAAFSINETLYSDDFDGDLGQWVVEQAPGGSAWIEDGKLEINDSGGCTVWFKQKLTAPVMIEYEATILDAGGANDNVRDLNCFWMAIDPQNPDDIFKASSQRGGKFSNYHGLRLYYVGCGGNGNTTTRFRRYPGTGERPLLPEHDLTDPQYLLEPNKLTRIQLVAVGDRVQYIRDGQVVFDYQDADPYKEGWFGLRTVSNHMVIDRFRVHSLTPSSADISSQVAAYVSMAGNTDDEAQRLAILRELRDLDGISPDLQKHADSLIEEIEKWNNSPWLGYFSRAVSEDKEYDFGVPDDSPLYPIAQLYQGRMITWYSNEYGHIWGFPEPRRRYMDRARKHFEAAHKAFPANRLAAMYLGERLAPAVEYPGLPDAPDWAVYQREGLERLADVIEWWIDNRQREDGSYGGGWGDDCEMWRLWVPVLIGFDSEKINNAQALLSKAIMEQDYMKGGYTSHVSDVQHTSEETADSLTPMMHLEPENEYWSTKALRLADLMENLWTGKNDRGMLQFKSTYFSADALNLEPQKSCDTFYHPRAVQPALLYWQRTGDERLTKLFSSWMDTWVDASAREENGKPAGILPSAIHWPDGKVGGLSEDWWDPRNYSPPSIYAWPGVMRIMNDTLLLTYHVTGDDNYLAPLRSMARIRAGYTKAPGEPPPVPGGLDWCASKLGGITSALAKYRFLTGSDEFDELLEAEKSPYIALRMSNEWQPVTSALASVAEALRYNFESNTSEVRWTDRVFTFPRLFGNNGIYEEALPGFRRPWIDLLYSTATGDPGTVGYFPMNAVRWLAEPRDIAAIVTQAGTNTFEAQLYHFGEDVRRMGAEFYLLSFGDEGDEDQIEYRYELWEAIEEEPKWHQLARGDVTVEQNKGVIRFELPRQALYELRVIPK